MEVPTIQELIDVGQRFVRSTHLERDFSAPDALDGYISTPEVSSHLRRLGRGLRRGSAQRAWRVTGDYGSGKSSFALLLANILARPASQIPKELRPLRNELDLPRNSPKLLPVLVTGAREPLSTAMLRALRDTIQREVDGRRKLDCRELLERSVEDPSRSDRAAVEAIEATAREVVERGLYGGVLLVLDELGKFLEFAALHPERQDVYFLQQVGEAAARSGDCPLLVLGLLHQGFAAYAGKLSDSGRREWEKVAGRYDELRFDQPLTQVAKLLSGALGHRNSPAIRGWKGRAREDMAAAIDLGMFGPAPGKTELKRLAPELYPLHPTVLPVLARFFRRFGQNERSLFSFILSGEPHALQDFATRPASADSIYRLSDFYDFAAHNFAHRLEAQSFRSHWNHIDAIVRSAVNEDPPDLGILKTIGILSVVDAPGLRPDHDTLALALGDPAALTQRLAQLRERSLLYRRIGGTYALWSHSSVNLEQAKVTADEEISQSPPIADIVRERLDARPVVARRHYIQSGNLRHFSILFATATEFANSVEKLGSQHPADGLLVVVLCETVADRELAVGAAENPDTNPAVVVAVSRSLEDLAALALELERWIWIERNTPELKDDRLALEEVERRVAAVGQNLEDRINEWVGFRGNGTPESDIAWFHLGEPVQSLNEGRSTQSFLSDLCDELFSKAPQISNELVNRQSISSAAAAARQKLFGLMIGQGAEPELGFDGKSAPPERSMYLSVLHRSQIHRNDGDSWRIAAPPKRKGADPCNVIPSLGAIVEALEQRPDSRVTVADIWGALRSPPYGVRDGLVPLFLLTLLLEHEGEIAVYEDGRFQPEVSAELMQRLVKAPETFEFQLCRIRGVRREIVERLCAVVSGGSANAADLLSIVKPLCLFVGEELPDYVRNTRALTTETLALRDAVSQASEPADLVFNAIPKALGLEAIPSRGKGKSVAVDQLAERLGASLQELQRAFPELQARMAAEVIDAFDATPAKLGPWRAEIAPQAEGVLLHLSDQDLRAFCLKLHDEITPEAEWLESFGSLLTRRPPSRWSDKHESEFRERLHHLAGQFERVRAIGFDGDPKSSKAAVRVSLTRPGGQERHKVVELSAKQQNDARKLRSALEERAGKDRSVAMAAMSELLWTWIQGEEE